VPTRLELHLLVQGRQLQRPRLRRRRVHGDLKATRGWSKPGLGTRSSQ
jgi:hypothetical protein